MNRESSDSHPFSVGGTLPADTPSYIKRAADEELLKRSLAGEFCYVLTPRQMGKSSLMSRIFFQLRSQGVKTAIIDLSRIGLHNITVDQWYLGVLSQLQDHLLLTEEPSAWWQVHAKLSPVQRFTDFLRDVILTEISGQIVIFIDEIDFVLQLASTDDFFAAIRAMYNARAHDPEVKRLTFVLFGVGLPSELIKESSRTPFNIGQAIRLEEFSKDEATLLQEQLEAIFPRQGQAIFERIYYWTNGHPYLTQKLCLGVVQEPNRQWSDERIIDAWVKKQFQKNSSERDNNIKWVENFILEHEQRDELLELYKKVCQEEKVPDDGLSIIHNQLKLSGLVKVKHGYLRIRNKIYRDVFDLNWARKWSSTESFPLVSAPPSSINSAPPNRREIMRRISTALVLFLIGWAWVAVSSMGRSNASTHSFEGMLLLPTVTASRTSVSPTVAVSKTAVSPTVTLSKTSVPLTVTASKTSVPPTVTASKTPLPPTVTASRTPVPPTETEEPNYAATIPAAQNATPFPTALQMLLPTTTPPPPTDTPLPGNYSVGPVALEPAAGATIKSESVTFKWARNGPAFAGGQQFRVMGFRDGEWLQLATQTGTQAQVWMPGFGNFETQWQWYVVVIDSGGNEISPTSAKLNFGISLSSGGGSSEDMGELNGPAATIPAAERATPLPPRAIPPTPIPPPPTDTPVPGNYSVGPVALEPAAGATIKSESVTFKWARNGPAFAGGQQFRVMGFRDGEWLQLATQTGTQAQVWMPSFGNFETQWQWYVVVIDSAGNEISPTSAKLNFGISLSSGGGSSEDDDGGGYNGSGDSVAQPTPQPEPPEAIPGPSEEKADPPDLP